jgi:hypothetical protein
MQQAELSRVQLPDIDAEVVGGRRRGDGRLEYRNRAAGERDDRACGDPVSRSDGNLRRTVGMSPSPRAESKASPLSDLIVVVYPGQPVTSRRQLPGCTSG